MSSITREEMERRLGRLDRLAARLRDTDDCQPLRRAEIAEMIADAAAAIRAQLAEAQARADANFASYERVKALYSEARQEVERLREKAAAYDRWLKAAGAPAPRVGRCKHGNNAQTCPHMHDGGPMDPARFLP